MRLFAAILPNQEITDELVRLQTLLHKKCCSLRIIKPEMLHLTIKFLGEVEESMLPCLIQTLRSCAASFPVFSTALTACSCFPMHGLVRVVWVGLGSLNDALQRLSVIVEKRLVQCGFPYEPRPFAPHITIARAKREGAPTSLRQAISTLAVKTVPQEVYSLDLMQSVLLPHGSVYNKIESFKFS